MGMIHEHVVTDENPWLPRSAVVSYDNMAVNALSGSINFQNGPNLTARYAGRWWGIFGDFAPGRSKDQLHLLWSYSMPNGVQAAQGLKPVTLGGTTNGYITPGSNVDSRFGGKTLYGARLPATGNTAYDPANPQDQARLLGDHPDDATFAEHHRGISSWPRYSPLYTAIHQDDPIGAAIYSSIGGQFSRSMEEGFTAHGPGSYIDFLRSRYPTDAAYLADRSNPANRYDEYRVHMLRKVRSFFTDQYLPRAASLSMPTSANVFWPWPSESPATGHVLSDLFDFPLFEHVWWRYSFDGNIANYRTQRQASENVADATILLNAYSSLTAQFVYFQGIRKRAGVAIAPLMGWWPQPSAGNGSAPSTAPYEEPYRVRGLMRGMICWTLANGQIPVVPSGIYDGIFDDAPAPEYTGYAYPLKPMWYGNPDHYRDIYDFVGMHKWLIDEFDSAPTVALVTPCAPASLSFRRWGGSNNMIDTDYWVNSIIRPLISAHAQFTINPVGGEIRRIPLSRHQLGSYMAAVKMNTDQNFTAYFAEIPTGANVRDTATFLASDLSQFAPVIVSGESDPARPVLTNLRVRPSDKALALHLVNTNATDYAANSGAGAARARQTTVVATVKTAFLPARPKSVQWFEPGQSGGRPVRWEIASDGVRISVPPLAEWGVCLIEL